MLTAWPPLDIMGCGRNVERRQKHSAWCMGAVCNCALKICPKGTYSHFFANLFVFRKGMALSLRADIFPSGDSQQSYCMLIPTEID